MTTLTVFDILLRLIRRPDIYLIRRWNWKSAIFSPSTRSLIFFLANLSAGWRAAVGAMTTELIYRVLSAGFYGAMTQAFREAEPPWAASLTVFLLLPILQHGIEWAVHYAHGTPNLVRSICYSVCFTGVTTLFNLYAMRRGVLVTGKGCGSIVSDLKQVPRLIAGFVAFVPITLYRLLARDVSRSAPAQSDYAPSSAQ